MSEVVRVLHLSKQDIPALEIFIKWARDEQKQISLKSVVKEMTQRVASIRAFGS